MLLRNQAATSGSTYGHVNILHRLLSQAQLNSSKIPASTNVYARRVAPLSSSLNTLSLRTLHSTAIRHQQEKNQTERQGEETKKSDAPGSESEESTSQEKTEGKDNESQKENKDAPSPPPHGDKTPWQVFTETLRSEFKKSKEWEESTKALASSAHQFTESESVKRARAAYEAASSTASSTTSSAFKSTGKAIGQGAAWTWETPVVKGIRKGVSATGKGIEKATRPVRETEAYKTAVGGVKEAIDDGSSSRYGGWIEKEERRRQRQLREQNELKSSGRSGRAEKMEEDPK
jgi:import inner membrane translocase subunit TIM44